MSAQLPGRAPMHLPSRREAIARERAARRSPLAWLREIGIILLVAFCVSALLRAFIIQVFWIPSPSMADTLSVNDRISVSRISAWVGDVQRGDVVVFDDANGWLAPDGSTGIAAFIRKIGEFSGFVPADGKQILVKRVIGMPGDRVECCSASNKISVNGVEVTEPYLPPGTLPSTVSFDVVVPEGHVWVMGDNRSNSSDSRYHMENAQNPFIPLSAIVGRANAVIWPSDHWRGLGDRDVFAHIPDPQ